MRTSEYLIWLSVLADVGTLGSVAVLINMIHNHMCSDPGSNFQLLKQKKCKCGGNFQKLGWAASALSSLGSSSNPDFRLFPGTASTPPGPILSPHRRSQQTHRLSLFSVCEVLLKGDIFARIPAMLGWAFRDERPPRMNAIFFLFFWVVKDKVHRGAAGGPFWSSSG